LTATRQFGLRVDIARLQKLYPLWDPLRSDSRFEKIVTSLLRPQIPRNHAQIFVQ
jgi:hypothetical protein